MMRDMNVTLFQNSFCFIQNPFKLVVEKSAVLWNSEVKIKEFKLMTPLTEDSTISKLFELNGMATTIHLSMCLLTQLQ